MSEPNMAKCKACGSEPVRLLLPNEIRVEYSQVRCPRMDCDVRGPISYTSSDESDAGWNELMGEPDA